MRTLPVLSILAFASLTACESSNTQTFEQCELDLELSPASALVGESVDATGLLLTEPLDTVVLVDGLQAPIDDLVQTDACAGCDACRQDAGCVCATCADACDAACADCTRTLTFTVPDAQPGTADVMVTNRFGTSEVLDLQILPDPE